jgi:hypothetical protein
MTRLRTMIIARTKLIVFFMMILQFKSLLMCGAAHTKLV